MDQIAAAEIKEKARAISGDLIKIRRQIHRNPEPSGCEKQTAALVAERLRGMGYQVTEQVGGFGVIGVLNGGSRGKTVALRADMDALQLMEQNETEYCSQNEGIMHACGHDNHIAILLGAARILMDKREEIHGAVRLIFQPAEEMSPVGGSRKMIEAGALEGVDAIFGLHMWPDLPHGTIGVKSGAMMAASDHFSADIYGKSSHAGQPDVGIDAVVMGAQFVQAVQNIVSREISPLRSAVVTIGRFNAGNRYNIVAENCSMEGTCRTYNEEVRNHVETRLKDIMQGICLMHGVEGKLSYERGYMALVNDQSMTEVIAGAAARLFGEQAVAWMQEPSMCAEDFAFYLKERPGAFVWLGTGTEELCHPLHNPRFDVDEDILWRGAALLAETALEFLSE